MATDLMSLFNTGGYDPVAEQRKQQALFQQQLAGATDPRSFIATVGSNLGGQLGGAAMRMFGPESEQEKQQKAVKQAMAESQGETDPVKRLRSVAERLRAMGMEGAALTVDKQADDFESKALTQKKTKFDLTEAERKRDLAIQDREKEAAQITEREAALKKNFPNMSPEEIKVHAATPEAYDRYASSQIDKTNTGTTLNLYASKLYGGKDYSQLSGAEKQKVADAVAKALYDKKSTTTDVKPPPERVISSHVAVSQDASDAQYNIEKADDLINKVKTGVAKYGLVTNIFGQASTLFGNSTESEIVKGDIQSFITESVNAILNMAKGPQTDKDAARAEKQILQNALANNDSKAIQAGLERLKKIHERALRNSKAAVDAYERQYPTLKPKQATGKATKRYNPATGKMETI